MSLPNMWGELEEFNEIKSPVIYLKEQAEILNKMTKGVVLGVVRKSPVSITDSLKIKAIFNIVVPPLNNYTYTLLSVTYDPTIIYPLTLLDYANGMDYTCNNESEFQNTLKNILSSPKTKEILSKLLAESKA